MKFIKSNWVYVLWFIVYFLVALVLLGVNVENLIFIMAFYAISITIALSPIGEWLLRNFEGARRLETREEREYLEPLFEEVCQNAKAENPKLSDNIGLFIIDAMFVNAFAMGRNTIAVTTGAIESFTEDELKGVLAHELGHITYGHTKALLLSVIGNMLFSVLILILRLIIFAVDLLNAIFAQTSIGYIIMKIMTIIVNMVFNASIFLFMYLGQILLSLNSRFNEFEADEFAYKINFGDELISALYLLKKISGSHKMTLKEKMTASHPHIAVRIGRLERMQEENENQ